MKSMRVLMVVMSLMLSAATCSAQSSAPRASGTKAAPTAAAKPFLAPSGGALPARADEDEAFRKATVSALAYMKAMRAPKTGLVQATAGWGNITLWDIGSLIGAVYAAGELELLPPAERDKWIGQLLTTLETAPMFDKAAFNRVYVASSAALVGPDDKVSTRGSGWSAIDVGRLLIMLKVVETGLPQFADEAKAVADRIDYARTLKDGLLVGANLNAKGGIDTYPEGRIGYEQYAARGFQLWGHEAPEALDARAHAEPVAVMGQTLLHDSRGGDKLTSEPFILMGMELGYLAPFDEMSKAMLAIQEARYRETGKVTIVSEDAVEVPPWYFYYYSVYSEGETFAVRAHGPVKNGPRWVSAKAAFAWHALFPSAYTWTAVETVQPARLPNGWSSGVFEGNHKTTGVRNLNTAAVIMEAALYRKLGRPFLAGS